MLAALAAAVLVAWWLRPANRDFVHFPPQNTGPWVAFGDSLTEGFGASEGRDYPTVLGRRIGVKILNYGRSGHTTTDGLNRVEEVAKLNPRVVLLCLGGNDTLEQERRAKSFANLGSIIDRLHQRGAFVVLIGVRSASLRDRNKEHFTRLAEEKKVFHVPDLLRGVFLKPIYMSDAVHPNDEGYRIIAERIEKAHISA